MYYLGLAIMLLPIVAIALLIIAVAAMLFVGAYDIYARFAARRKKGVVLKPAKSETD